MVVIRGLGPEGRTWYAVSNAHREVELPVVVGVHATRHRMEEALQEGKGEVGLGQYEVRSWVGWHHHMTLALVALWFLCLERRHIGGENPGDHRVSSEADLHAAPASPGAGPQGDCRGDHAGAAA